MKVTSAVPKSVREKIVKYLIKNPIERGKYRCYADIADKFGVTAEQVRRIYRTLKENGTLKNDLVAAKIIKTPGIGKKDFEENIKAGTGSITAVSDIRIKTLAQLIKVCEIDTSEWNIDRWLCNKWEVGAKGNDNKIHVTPLFQIKVWLSRRVLATDLVKQKEALLNEIKAYSPRVAVLPRKVNKGNGKLLEISLPDIHFGKLAWREETGEDYDLKITEERVKTAVHKLLDRVNLNNVEKILFPIGNDLIHIDNRHNTTFAGTPQDSDCRYMKIIKVAKRVLVEIIDELATIAPVEIIIVPGNHDTTTCFMIGEILEAFYHNNKRVNVDNAPKLRKYFQFGYVGIQLTHGDQEKHAELGMIFAAEEAQLWAATKFRFCQLGHFHKNKKLQYVSVDEYQGFLVQTMPSLSGTDFWHKGKGYNSLKQAKAFLYDRGEGVVGEFTTTVTNIL